MPHGHTMRGTRLDYIMVIGLLLLFFIVIVTAANPVRAFKLARDEERSDDVRQIMSAILTLSQTNTEKSDALMNRLKAREGEKFLLGSGNSCSGDWGRHCSDAYIPDDCLPPEEIFSTLEETPADPKRSFYGIFATGYYVTLDGDMLEVGSCGADTGVIVLKTFAP